ncbi:MAG: TRAP transporter small permease [Neomegalonema sp.]|nr:TRAP transporter small permease [Neomegalonema sp.]
MNEKSDKSEDWIREHADPALAPRSEDDEAVDISDIHWSDAVPIFAFAALAFVVFLQFFSRYVINDSIGWTEEIARYLLIIVTFTGAIIAVRRDSHVVVEFFYRYLPAKLRWALSTLVDILKLLFFTSASWYTYVLASRSRQKMASIELPKAVIYWIVMGCFIIMAVYTLALLITRWRTGGPLAQPAIPPAPETGGNS